jgi:sec-independent protein translocase protein TatB
MFNIGPLEFVVLAVVGLIVLGPDRLPGLARDAARMIRTLREMATGARTQLRDELGPEFADLDLRSLNPRTAIQRVLLGDDEDPVGNLMEPDKPVTRPPAQKPLAAGEAAPFDEDAT